jgi:ABC-2 type transport system permease protein
MNTQSNVAREAPLESQAVAFPVTSIQQLYWSVRRELWESRWIYLAPLGVAGIYLAGFLISMIHGFAMGIAVASPAGHKAMEPYHFAEFLIMGTTFIVAIFYCLDSLYGERRDRSILFWKSLPVSDLTTVLAKASIPVVASPLLTFALTFALESIMMLVTSGYLLTHGRSLAMLGGHVPGLQFWLMLLYHLVAIHGLWYAPLYGWLILASAWATRAPYLWASLPPLAIGFAEKIAFNTSYFAALIEDRIGGGSEGPKLTQSLSIGQLTPGQFLVSPGLWIGLAITALFLFAAARLRRYRGPF